MEHVAMTTEPNEGAPRLVTIEYFVNMLGMKSRQWYYLHRNDPDMPRLVKVNNRAMLLYDECVAYINSRIDAREPAPKAAQAKPKRRRIGRPVGSKNRPK